MLTDIYEINQKELKELYSFAIDNESNFLIFGPGGVGKTLIAMQACKDAGYKYRYVNLSTLESPDMVGLPKISDDKTVFATPEFLPLEGEGEPMVLIVDELDKAADEVENPMLELFQFRSINGRKLNVKAIIATGNLPNERAKSKLVSHVLANRCMIYKLRCEFAPWRKWALESGKIHPLVLSFLDKKQNYLLVPPNEKDPTAYCHPSPRSWSLGSEELSSYLKSADKTDESLEEDPVVDFGYKIMAGRIGVKAALDFKIWIKHYRSLEPVIENLLETGEYPIDLSNDKIMVIILGCLNRIKEAILNEEDDDIIDKYVANAFGWQLQENIPPDLSLAGARSVFTSEFMKEHDLLSYDDVHKLYLKKINNFHKRLM